MGRQRQEISVELSRQLNKQQVLNLLQLLAFLIFLLLLLLLLLFVNLTLTLKTYIWHAHLVSTLL